MTLQEEITRRRTFAVIAHPDAGKTTLTEKLLLFGGAIHVAGAVKSNKIKKGATSDFMEIERQRGISVATAVMGFEYKGAKINILDTPGHEDFAEDTFRTLTAVDSVIIVIDGAKGVESQTRKLMEVCRMRSTPVIVFINKLDRPSKEPFDLLDEVEKELRIRVRPLAFPISNGPTFRGVYNLYEKNLSLFTSDEKLTADAQTAEISDLASPELDSYIGLATVKEEVRNLINMASVYKLRRQHDLPTTDMSLHMVFTGNPGTGKTMMARMMARIYRSLDILSKGQLVEVDRSGLVAGYVGQTAIKTQKVIQKALGGVLFIDEAYALNGKSENDFGQEAIDTILKAMEDHRDDLVVIVAGYTDLMDRFIHSNPGLESRFNRFLLFEDYTSDEMLDIFKMQCKKGCYQLSDGVEELVRDYITEENGDPETFGNARGVRNIFEHILVAQNNRLAAMETVTKEDLMTLTQDDVLHARGKLD